VLPKSRALRKARNCHSVLLPLLLNGADRIGPVRHGKPVSYWAPGQCVSQLYLRPAGEVMMQGRKESPGDEVRGDDRTRGRRDGVKERRSEKDSRGGRASYSFRSSVTSSPRHSASARHPILNSVPSVGITRLSAWMRTRTGGTLLSCASAHSWSRTTLRRRI
jgi:hypothetical protein